MVATITGRNFWYDRLGRLTVSQNARQQDSAQYSYTVYDTIGRITQVGQMTSANNITDTISRSQASLLSWMEAAASTRELITSTVYDSVYTPLAHVMAAENVGNSVAWTALHNVADDFDNNNPAAATYYSYDILGNVDKFVQDYKSGVMADNGNRFKKIVYDYDLRSGKVNQVSFQQGQPDAFYHKYYYDA